MSLPSNERQPSQLTAASKDLQVFANPEPSRDYLIHMQIPEFTCLCPLTGQPDFAHFTIEYIADQLCIELKSLKLYMWTFRDVGAFHEKVTNDLLTDFVRLTSPRFMRVTSRWWVRGGIYTNVVAEHKASQWHGQIPAAQIMPLAQPYA